MVTHKNISYSLFSVGLIIWWRYASDDDGSLDTICTWVNHQLFFEMSIRCISRNLNFDIRHMANEGMLQSKYVFGIYLITNVISWNVLLYNLEKLYIFILFFEFGIHNSKIYLEFRFLVLDILSSYNVVPVTLKKNLHFLSSFKR